MCRDSTGMLIDVEDRRKIARRRSRIQRNGQMSQEVAGSRKKMQEEAGKRSDVAGCRRKSQEDAGGSRKVASRCRKSQEDAVRPVKNTTAHVEIHSFTEAGDVAKVTEKRSSQRHGLHRSGARFLKL